MSDLAAINRDEPIAGTWEFQPMDRGRARSVLRWRYDPPYDYYNPLPPQQAEWLPVFCDPKHSYFSLENAALEICAFCCFGGEARVPGGIYADLAVDIGLGVRPDLTGKGRGSEFVALVVAFARARYSPTALRVTVATFNERAKRVWRRAGFRFAERFARELDGHLFEAFVLRD